MKGNRLSKKTPITPRQQEIGVLLALGFSAKEVAGKLGISYASVQTQRTALFSKVGVDNVVRFCLWMVANGHIVIRTGPLEGGPFYAVHHINGEQSTVQV